MSVAHAWRFARYSRRLLFVVALGIVLMVVGAPRADAHAFLWDSNPADGAVLATPPSVLTMEFSESVVLSTIRIDIVDGDGHHYAPTGVRSNADANSPVKQASFEVLATLPALGRNTYRLSWDTISSDDLHRTSGIIVFGVEQQVRAAGLLEPKPRADEASLRWLLFLSLSGSLGGLLVGHLCRRRAPADTVALAARCRRIAAASAGTGALIAIALLADQLLTTRWAFGDLAHSSYGQRWAMRELGFAVLLAGILKTSNAGRRLSLRNVLLGTGATLTCFGSAALGHASAGAQLATTRVLADAAHLAAAATWSGAVVLFAVMLVSRLRSGHADADSARAVLRGFAIPAAACMSVMVVTGLYLASNVVGSVDAALRTFYGRTLLVKIALFGVAALLGLANWRRLESSPARSTRRLKLPAEAVAAVVILALAAVLTSGQPARERQLVRTTTGAGLPLVSASVADLQETMAVKPNRPGQNVVLMSVFDTRRPSPGPVTGVDVTIVGADGVQSQPIRADRLSDGTWSATAAIPQPGQTRVAVTTHRSGLPDAIHTYPWTVLGAPSQVITPIVSNAPIRAAVQAIAAIVGIALGVLWAGWLYSIRRRRRTAHGHDNLLLEQAEADDPTTAAVTF
jgi:copper transport protein